MKPVIEYVYDKLKNNVNNTYRIKLIKSLYQMYK